MKTTFCFVFFFVFFYLLNTLTPMSFGDDYVYSFVWEGHSLYEPLSENAIRISSWKNLLESQIFHYFTWSGRIVNHTLAQLFLWAGKGVFNLFNTLISIFLLFEIYWCSHKGIVNLKASNGMLFGIFFALWAFTPGHGSVFLWVDGACNYLWTMVILIGFLIPYFKKFYLNSGEKLYRNYFCFCFFLFGIVAGCTNENTVCFILPILAYYTFKLWKSENSEQWMFFGVAGLTIGYALLMLSPGNVARLLAEQKGYSWVTWAGIKENALVLFMIFAFFHIFLWYFNLRSIYTLGVHYKGNRELEKEAMMAKILCMVSFCMTFSMLFSPNFPARSGFPGTVFLIISACIMMRIQAEYEIQLIQINAMKFLRIVGTFYFIITTIATFYGSYQQTEQIQKLISIVKSSDNAKRDVIEVDSLLPVNETISGASGLHLIDLKLSDNENDWKNVAFSRYYGIKGIRVTNWGQIKK